jgi:hypothetical protein
LLQTSYLVDREEPPTLDAELRAGLRDETTREIARKALRLPEREREISLGIAPPPQTSRRRLYLW